MRSLPLKFRVSRETQPSSNFKTIRAVVPSVAHAHRYPVLPTKVDRKSETFTFLSVKNRQSACRIIAELMAE